ncbi:30S ribosomal protein S3 [Candidatus Peregrinibacteria bacterium]|nr:30S ribosomal protein S3 [Candidatus Peregrinibacteria bacterium]
MGQKVNPKSLRLGIIRSWDSKWFANKRDFAKLFHADLKLKKVIGDRLKNAAVTRIEIERSAKKVTVHVHAAKPGLIIGRQGVMIEDLKEYLRHQFNQNIDINIHEVPDPDLSALLIGQMIASQIERRIAYRRAVKTSLQKAIEAGAKGAKVQIAGRLNGVEISRREYFKEGNIPLHTLRADIDYAKVEANTTYGVIGIKVWIYKGMVFKKEQAMKQAQQEKKEEE